ncbi:MAG: Na/Pi cotransporter family protein [Treponema sp.]|jgi:phosphate:Na+ symporter|nr:Na/Pi cotransporter family protein [Treponema sp.]
MVIVFTLLRITGGLCLFLYGMKVMSEGIQQAAGDKLQRILNFMTGNRFIAVFTGLAITAIVQSSSATTVMVVSLVNAGLLSLTQSISVIMGANIGTTVTAWVVSLIGFSLNLSEIALPAVGIGFIWGVIKWKHRVAGDFILGFGLLFLGLDLLTESMPPVGNSFELIATVSNMGFLSYLLGAAAGVVITLVVHSSLVTMVTVEALAINGVITFEMAAVIILGANIGTTIDAALAAIGTKTNAKRAALVHFLFNFLGLCWALPMLKHLLALVNLITPGTVTPGIVGNLAIPTHLAMLHTVFNTVNTCLFLPFVKPFAALVSFIIKDDLDETKAPERYRLAYTSSALHHSPEMNIMRAEKEIQDMAGLVSSMFARFCTVIQALPALPESSKLEPGTLPGTGARHQSESVDRQSLVAELSVEMREKEDYADAMREQIGAFLMECAKKHLNQRSEHRVSQLMQVISNLEEMTDDCCNLSFLLEKSVKKDRLFKAKEMDALMPYLKQVEDFLNMVKESLGHNLSPEALQNARDLEESIDRNRDKLRKLGQKRIEAGEDVKTEILFIDLARRIEKFGDYCSAITETLAG